MAQTTKKLSVKSNLAKNKKPVAKRNATPRKNSEYIVQPSMMAQDSKKYTNMFAAWKAFWKRGFSEWAGTSSRSEYWWSVLVNVLIFGAQFVLAMVLLMLIGFGVTIDSEPVFWIGIGTFGLLGLGCFLYSIALVIPLISMMVRRYHDVGLSAWIFVAVTFGSWVSYLFAMFVFGLNLQAGLGAGLVFYLLYLVGTVANFVVTLLPTKTENNPYHKFNK